MPDQTVKILVVDDNPATLYATSRVLRSAGWEVSEAQTGVEGVELAQHGADLVVLDVNLPDIDGFEVCRRIRASETTSRTAVLHLSATFVQNVHKVHGLEAGADGYLTHPIEPPVLIATVNALLRARKAESDFRESETRFKAVFQTALNGVAVLDESYLFVDVNPAMCQLLEEDRHEVLGRSLFDFVPEDQVANVRGILEQLDVSKTWRGIFPLRSAGGAKVHLEWSLSTHAPGMRLAIVSDITNRIHAEEAQRVAERRWRLAMDSAELGAWNIDPAGNLLGDQRFCDIFGFSEGECNYERAVAALHPEDREIVLAAIAAAIDPAIAAPYAIEYRVIRADGAVCWVYAKGRATFDESGLTRQLVSFDGTIADVTSQKSSEAALQDARSRLESTLAAGNVATWEFDILKNTVRADQNLARTFGVTQQEAAGGSLESYMKAIHPEDQERITYDIRQALAQGSSFESEYRVISPVGGTRWVVARGRVERDSWGRAVRLPGVMVDITDRKQAEEQARRLLLEAATANAKFEAVFDQGALIAGIMDTSGILIEANRLSWEGCGYSKRQMIGKSFWQGPWWNGLPDVAKRIQEGSELAAGGTPFRAELPYFFADGSQRFIDLHIHPIKDETGEISFLVPLGNDITEQKRLEENLRMLAAELSASDRRKTEFLATLGHELRNPLAPIRTGLELMRILKDDPKKIEETRSMMERQAQQLVRLIDDLLDLSRITQGKLELRTRSIELKEVLQSAVEATQPFIDEAGHELVISEIRDEIFLEGDPNRLAQVFSNLLNNASKYTASGGQIRVDVARNDQDVIVTVKDNGIGIALESQASIFEMFSQLDPSEEHGSKGLGIGLTLVKRFVEMHGGTIQVHSAGKNQGSEFSVRLPTSSMTSETLSKTVKPAQARSSNRHRVLVVDDNKAAADMLSLVVKMAGNEVRTAYDGLQGVDLAEKFRPELILMDLGMPKMNGYEAAQHIRKQPWSTGMVLVALTGWGQDTDRERTSLAGFDEHLVKPAEPSDLKAILASLPANN